MRRLLRRLRGMLGLGLVWAVVWTPTGAGIFIVQYLATGSGFPPWSLLAPILLTGARDGFLAGFLFAGGMSLAFRNRTVAELRPVPFGVIGALAGMVLPLMAIATAGMAAYLLTTRVVVAMFGFAGVLGAATAIGSLKLAQAAPPGIEDGDPRRILEPPGAS